MNIVDRNVNRRRNESLQQGSPAMTVALPKLAYPHSVSDPGIAGGAPIFEGIKFSIRTMTGDYQMGMPVDEILATLSRLTVSQIHSALTSCFDLQQEIAGAATSLPSSKTAATSFHSRPVLVLAPFLTSVPGPRCSHPLRTAPAHPLRESGSRPWA
ncbi:DUF433 domain-containing protein [candidate division KSB1 bacterium]|nr:DUF433 domain-containing protein [candidate division KSB1 bacterium]